LPGGSASALPLRRQLRPSPSRCLPWPHSPQAVESRQDKEEALKTVTAFTGLTAEEVERQLQGLRKALRELKA